MRRLPPARTQRCVLCGSRATNWHHRVTRARGGPTDPFNMVPLCGSGTTGCHGWVGANPEAAEAKGLYVRGSFIRGRYVGPEGSFHQHYNLGVLGDDEGEALEGPGAA